MGSGHPPTDPHRLCVVLWPGGCSGPRVTSAAEVWAATQAEGPEGVPTKTVTLILLDSTWTGARRMMRRLPATVTCWALSGADLSWHTADGVRGLLPLFSLGFFLGFFWVGFLRKVVG